MNHLAEIVSRNKAGEGVGIYAVCSAHPSVLEASIRQAREDGTYLLIEATSNQVDQFGGYTGMRPEQFRDLVFSIADAEGFPRTRLILGGDHLGPNRWQSLPAEEAMMNAEGLIAAYVEAGYTKIHLDCSMSCGGDPVPLGDQTVAERTARLLDLAEKVAARRSPLNEPFYVIGTEVPVPGGAHEKLEDLAATTPEAARDTLDHHRKAFSAKGLDYIWPRIAALVVQPAVEFDHAQVVDYSLDKTVGLSDVLNGMSNTVFEAHSTDYQDTARLTDLVKDHWAILKVGPGLTFAMREALFALARIEDEVVPAENRSDLIEIIEQRMLANPKYWGSYYHGDADEQRVARRFSYSDRIRYYWPDQDIDQAVRRLYENLDKSGIPLTLLSQFLPAQYARVRAGHLVPGPHELTIDKIRDALRPYAFACNPQVRERVSNPLGAVRV